MASFIEFTIKQYKNRISSHEDKIKALEAELNTFKSLRDADKANLANFISMLIPEQRIEAGLESASDQIINKF